VSHIVPKEQLTAAIAQNEARTRGASFLGRPVGGLLFGLGRAVPFGFDAVSYAASFATLAATKVRFNDDRVEARRHIVVEIREGIGWLWRQPFLRACALLIAGSNFIFQALVLSIIVLIKDHGANSATIGFTLAGFGGGGLLGSFLAPWLQPRLSPRAVVVGANWLWAALIPPIVLIPHPYAIFILGGTMAFVGPLWNVVLGSYAIRLTPDELLGRVGSVIGVLTAGAIPLGSLAAGFAIKQFGARPSILALGGLMIVIAFVATLLPSVRQAPVLT